MKSYKLFLYFFVVMSWLVLLCYISIIINYKVNSEYYFDKNSFKNLQNIQFNEEISSCNNKIFSKGWSICENPFVWSCEKKSSIFFGLDTNRILKLSNCMLTLNYYTLIDDTLNLNIKINNIKIGQYSILKKLKAIDILVPNRILKTKNKIEIEIPKAHGVSNDSRKLGIALMSFVVNSEPLLNKTEILANDKKADSVFYGGWGICEENKFRWSNDKEVYLNLDFSKYENISDSLNLRFDYLMVNGSKQIATLLINDSKIEDLVFDSTNKSIKAKLPFNLLSKNSKIKLIFHNAKKVNNDSRLLGVALTKIVIYQ